MAVAHDLATESHTGTTPSTSVASFNWSHGGAATIKGVLVWTFNTNANAQDVTSVTYGGVSLPAVTGGEAADATTEPGRCKAWFCGTGLPGGTQTVVVNRNNNANEVYAIAISVTAGFDTWIPTTPVLAEANGAVVENAITDNSPGTNSVRYAGCYYGGTAVVQGANSTLLPTIVIASARSAGAVRETTAGQGSRSVGFNMATDDRAAVYLVVSEMNPNFIASIFHTPPPHGWYDVVPSGMTPPSRVIP